MLVAFATIVSVNISV